MLTTLKSLLSGGRFAPATVRSITRLSPHMLRIRLHSDMIAGFPKHCAGAHFKMVVPNREQTPQAFAKFVAQGGFKHAMRTYTVRSVQSDAATLDVDIVTHGDVGRVGAWAQRAKPGDDIVISRCGAPKLVVSGMSRIVAATDLTGFPALAAGLETLAPNVHGDAFIEIPHLDDVQPLETDADIRLHWIVKPDPFAPSDGLIDAIKRLDAPDHTTSVFIAAEFSTVAVLRNYFNTVLKVTKAQSYISSYWKAGLNELEHKVVKAAA